MMKRFFVHILDYFERSVWRQRGVHIIVFLMMSSLSHITVHAPASGIDLDTSGRKNCQEVEALDSSGPRVEFTTYPFVERSGRFCFCEPLLIQNLWDGVETGNTSWRSHKQMEQTVVSCKVQCPSAAPQSQKPLCIHPGCNARSRCLQQEV